MMGLFASALVPAVMALVIIIGGVVWFGIRHIYHDRLTAAYCEGFRDGVNYEVKVQAEQGRRAVMRTVMSLN